MHAAAALKESLWQPTAALLLRRDKKSNRKALAKAVAKWLASAVQASGYFS